MLVVGTAGHIDHGKSSIVRRLTGTDPDRLPEERARGMTIDLGFAFYHAADGTDIAFVDVPGHERFVRNMIAGAGGIDAVMLVVAADDGWMPQSEEHFQICRLLGIRSGWIVINKCDLVEPDWLELLEEEIRERVAGSFLEDAEVFRVSAQTGEGFEALQRHLDSLGGRMAARRDIGKARLFIDRSFVRPGIGGVVTGTLRGGSFRVGQNVTVWPARVTGKIRTLHSMNRPVDVAMPGQRTAVSFTGVDREDLVRGGVVSDRLDLEYFHENPVLALSVELLSDAPVPLSDRRRALVIVGTTEAEGEVRMFERDRLEPGERGIVFFRPDEPVYALVADHFIMRLPTPMVTLGGGQVLDHLPRFPRRRELVRLSYFQDRLPLTPEALVLSELRKRCLTPVDTLLEQADVAAADVQQAVHALMEAGTVARFEDVVYEKATVERATGELRETMEAYLSQQPHLASLGTDEIYRLSVWPRETTRRLLALMTARGELRQSGERFAIAGREPRLSGPLKGACDDITAKLRESPYEPLSLAALAANGKVYQQAIRYLLDHGEAYKCGAQFLFLPEVWREVTAFIREYLDEHDALPVSALRDRFGFTRKYAIPILEETDRLGLTRREGDVRVRGDRLA